MTGSKPSLISFSNAYRTSAISTITSAPRRYAKRDPDICAACSMSIRGPASAMWSLPVASAARTEPGSRRIRWMSRTSALLARHRYGLRFLRGLTVFPCADVVALAVAVVAVVLVVLVVAVVAVVAGGGIAPTDCCWQAATPGTFGAWRPA